MNVTHRPPPPTSQTAPAMTSGRCDPQGKKLEAMFVETEIKRLMISQMAEWKDATLCMWLTSIPQGAIKTSWSPWDQLLWFPPDTVCAYDTDYFKPRALGHWRPDWHFCHRGRGGRGLSVLTLKPANFSQSLTQHLSRPRTDCRTEQWTWEVHRGFVILHSFIQKKSHEPLYKKWSDILFLYFSLLVRNSLPQWLNVLQLITLEGFVSI